MIDQELLNCFLDEALDSLSQWERACLDLETNPSAETYNTLFRSAHNLKGASRAVGLDHFGGFVHAIEDLITLVIKGQLAINPAIIGVLLQCQVELVAWVEQLRTNSEVIPPVEMLVTKLKAVTMLTPEDLAIIAEGLLNPTEAPPPSATSEASPGNAPAAGDDLEAMFEAARQEYAAKAQSTEAPAQVSTSPAPVSESAAPSTATPPTEAPAETKKAAESKPGETKAAPKVDETIRISAHKLDELLQLIGELSIHQAIVFQAKKTGTLESRFCQNAVHLSNKIVKDLYGKALSLRMQPVQGLFQRLERVARDVARTQNKKIAIVLEGTEVELDKTVIERITDPLIHILRNAVDHGIETTEERLKSGKSEVSTVTIGASQDAAGVCLKVAEDGRGLHRDKILKKALEKGLVSANQQLSESQVNNLIFLPGFSTADKVTDISGRGVGMDVVMKAVQALQGNIDLRTVAGKGTTFAITLPTSLSIVEALVLRLADIRYAVAMHEVTEIIDLSEYTIDTSGNKGRMLSLRGEVVPLQNLNEHFKLPITRKVQQTEGKTSKPALVIRDGGEAVAFEVDHILGQQQVVVRPLSKQLSGVPGFSGSMILGDGEPGMIVCLAEIARNYLKASGSRETRI